MILIILKKLFSNWVSKHKKNFWRWKKFSAKNLTTEDTVQRWKSASWGMCMYSSPCHTSPWYFICKHFEDQGRRNDKSGETSDGRTTNQIYIKVTKNKIYEKR